MSQLTKDERQNIAENPFGKEVDDLRDILAGAERSLDPPGDGDNATKSLEKPRLFVAAMSRFLALVTASDVATTIASRTGGRDLLSDLAALRSRIKTGDFELDLYRPLARLLTRRATDEEIWSAIITLVQAVSRITPPTSTPQSCEDTPITHSSASQQGSEQTRRNLDTRLLEEIRYCTYRDVEGFYQKYFKDKSWTKSDEQVRKIMDGRHIHGRWKDIPQPPVQKAVMTWWCSFQEDLLADASNSYYQSTLKETVGTENRRQVDLFVKRKVRKDPKLVEEHDWRDILVIGELKQSKYDLRGTMLQISRYVRDVFSHQPTRRFVHAFTLSGTEMETWVFDRSGPYSAKTFDVHEEPEKFVQIICGYVMMSDEELGLNTFTEQAAGKQFITLPANGPCGKKRKLELEPDPIAHQRAIVCRGTAVYGAKSPRAEKRQCVVKFSWTSAARPSEADLLAKAEGRGVKGVPRLYGHKEITSISKMREGLKFDKPQKFRITSSANSSFSQSQSLTRLSKSFNQLQSSNTIGISQRKRRSTDTGEHVSKRSRSNSQRTQAINRDDSAVEGNLGNSLLKGNNEHFDDRVFRVLAITPAGKSITQFESITELLEGLRDAIKVHRSLYGEGQILHRDISENNIIIPTDPKTANGLKGMLIDLDLAKEIGKGSSGARHRTGTMEFMAIDVLSGKPHTYRHDLEAFFYVLIWLCARRGWRLPGEAHPKHSMLSRWYTGTYKEIAQNKLGDMNKGSGKGLEVILDEFPPSFECVKSLCAEIRDILFPYREGLFTGTPQDPESLYGPILTAFDSALARFRISPSDASKRVVDS